MFKQSKVDIVSELMDVSHSLLVQTKSLADFLGTTGIEFDRYFAELQELADSATGD